ncbi:jg2208 [Pararge aegeria aegeria]|uniref:Jg2208 protein n=1 Tax=Pararge aegeria aegeria TaxID=348720 RepID=A0A8S4QRC7_9NEOP|nr:jg2208 [Pararge aegeria aegeria]
MDNTWTSMSNIKSSMQEEWLRQKGIYFEDTWRKAVLIKQNKGPPTFAVDELLTAHGHVVFMLMDTVATIPLRPQSCLVKRKVEDKNVRTKIQKKL